MTTAPIAAFVSFRLGGSDGVSIEAAKWETALASLGYATRRVAGEILDAGRADDAVIPELGIEPLGEPSPDAVAVALAGADLVVVENLLSLPLNLPAARVVAKVLAGRPRVLLRHHDLPWQRERFAGVDDLPPALDGAAHAVINALSQRQLAERGVEAHLVRNHFDLEPSPGDRDGTRRRLGVGSRDLLVLHPVRAIPRKNVPGALALACALVDRLPGRPVHYWLPGPAEEGYEQELRAVLAAAPDTVRVLRLPAPSMADAYAACDLVAFPSTWEGFGNPVVEAVAHRRPVAVGRYPVLDELAGLGLVFPTADEPEAVAAVLTGAKAAADRMNANLRAARQHLDLELLAPRVRRVLRAAGWSTPR
jgi:glycosyltransferase involved in cell wall biosynthesis